jgi:hypothetical protein
MPYYSAASSAVDSFFGAQRQQSMLRMQANDLRLQQKLGKINAGLVDSQIQYMRRASEQKQMAISMQGAEAKANEKVKTASGNIALNTGTASERLTSIDYKTQVDMLTMNANDVMQIEAQQMRRVNLENRSMLSGVKADNMTSISRSISPIGQALQSGINSYVISEYNKLSYTDEGSYTGKKNLLSSNSGTDKWDVLNRQMSKNYWSTA